LELVTEAELDRRYRTAARLASGGDYGLGCLVVAGDPAGVLPVALDDEGIGQFFDEFGDVGTILIDGDVRSARHIVVSDRLMCLVVTGSLAAPRLSIFETEVLVCGDLDVGALRDHDDLLTVMGTRSVHDDEPAQ
jgi:hypothetical protein